MLWKFAFCNCECVRVFCPTGHSQTIKLEIFKVKFENEKVPFCVRFIFDKTNIKSLFSLKIFPEANGALEV